MKKKRVAGAFVAIIGVLGLAFTGNWAYVFTMVKGTIVLCNPEILGGKG